MLKKIANEPEYQDTKVLGLGWNTNDDYLYILTQKFSETNLTKRKLVSEVAQIYDPIGFLTPIIITAKILIQQIWKTKVSWDAKLNDNFHKIWTSFVQNMLTIQNFRIKRSINVSQGDKVELNIFCDASKKAYGVVCYLTKEDKNCFIYAKARVAPLKERSIPQLELTALLLAARISNFIKKSYKSVWNIKIHGYIPFRRLFPHFVRVLIFLFSSLQL